MDRDRAALIRAAFRLEWLTLGWMVVEAAVAIGAGLAAGSLTLTAFGLDSVIELGSASVLIWRLSVELRRGGAFPEAIEHRASRIAGALLFALAVYVVVAAAWGFWNRQGGGFSLPGLLVALAADSGDASARPPEAGRGGAAWQPGDAGGCGGEYHVFLAVGCGGGRAGGRMGPGGVVGGPAGVAWGGVVRGAGGTRGMGGGGVLRG